MKNVRLFDSFSAALDALVGELRGRRFSPDNYFVVLTPDRYTLKVEQALFNGTGAIDCEVITLSRLCRRVLGNMNTLSREGSVILMRRAVNTVINDLTYYARASHYTDFARQVYEAIEQAEASNADMTVLAGDAKEGKLHDLAIIKSEYDRLKEGYLDSAGKLKALVAAAPDAPFIRNAKFYAIGYADATRLNHAVFDAIAKSCRGFTYFDVDVKPELTIKNMEVYRAPDAVSQYKVIAARIRNHVIGGGKYGDISVICQNTRAISRIFREYDIDFYADNSAPLYAMPPLKLIEHAYKLHSGDCSAAVITALCANRYSGCEDIDAEELGYELNARGIRFCPKTRVLDREGARRALSRAYKLAAYFDGKSFPDAVDELITGEDFEGISVKLQADVKHLSSDDDLVFTDMITPIRNIIELIRKYGSSSVVDDAACFFSAAQSVEIRSVPRFSDRVIIGSDKTFRMTKCETLYIADFNEGVLPSTVVDTGLLSDEDIIASGGTIEPTVRELNRRSRRELYEVMRNARNVTCLYHTADGAKPSAFLSSVFDGRNNRSYSDEMAVLKKSVSAPYVARVCCSYSAAGEAAERGDTLYSAELKAATGKESSPSFVPTINGIKHDRLSVSELNHWFDCPYKRFLTDSVGVKERRKESFSAPDFGVVMHEFMQAFVEADYDTSAEFITRTVDRIIADNKLEPSKHEHDNIIRDATDYAVTNKRIIEAGAYRPIKDFTERGFGGDILLGKAGIPFVGRIDRVDECEHDSNRVRIIDYKTNDKKFDMGKCLDGRDMQLAMYAATVGKDRYVTGMFYVPLKNFFGDNNSKLRGCIVKDDSVIGDYDSRIFVDGRSDVLPYTMIKTKEGYKNFRNSATLLEQDDFNKLIDRCVTTASIAADEIDSGYIERTPADGACDYCPYKALCVDKKAR
ncbi:MAG: PD-(D/E)XK nuclease family protein [Clostridiales bacterium]|nr:PD-(D/E)XK nuclease family protein [Clostridiales bacterium]